MSGLVIRSQYILIMEDVEKALAGFVCGGSNTVTLAVTQDFLLGVSWDCS